MKRVKASFLDIILEPDASTRDIFSLVQRNLDHTKNAFFPRVTTFLTKKLNLLATKESFEKLFL